MSNNNVMQTSEGVVLMTDQKHTKEPWDAVELRGLSVGIVQKGNHDILIGSDGGLNGIHDLPRAVACVNALAGIENPEAFMRDVREYVYGYIPNGNRVAVDKHFEVNEHLKGQTND